MGTDVHFHTEIKIAGRWEHHSTPHIRPNYDLFGLLAGVRRGPSDALVPPKGLPADASAVTRLDFEIMGADAHTPSWFSAEEIVEFERRWALLGEHVVHNGEPHAAFGRYLEHNVLNTYLFGNSWAGWARWPQDRPQGVEDIRWVFWFDN